MALAENARSKPVISVRPHFSDKGSRLLCKDLTLYAFAAL